MTVDELCGGSIPVIVRKLAVEVIALRKRVHELENPQAMAWSRTDRDLLQAAREQGIPPGSIVEAEFQNGVLQVKRGPGRPRKAA